MSYSIIVDNLTKVYQQKTYYKLALNDLSLKIKSGSIIGLLGPNGAGKSTLINILANTVIKTSGKVIINGYDIDYYPKKARTQIGIVPQEIVIDNFFSINQMLKFSAGYYGIKVTDDSINEILKSLELLDKKHTMSKQLSGGMKRRFLIANAMIHNPAIVILDEPTAGVDIELREQLWRYIKSINNDHGTTIILTTHYLEEAQNLCDYIAFINEGRIIYYDTKNNILNNLGYKHIDIEFSNMIPDQKLEYFIKSVDTIEVLSKSKVRINIINDKTYNYIIDNIHFISKYIKDMTTYKPDLNTIFKKILNKK